MLRMFICLSLIAFSAIGCRTAIDPVVMKSSSAQLPPDDIRIGSQGFEKPTAQLTTPLKMTVTPRSEPLSDADKRDLLNRLERHEGTLHNYEIVTDGECSGMWTCSEDTGTWLCWCKIKTAKTP